MSGSDHGSDRSPPKVEFWLDFVSPYSWLALERAAEFGSSYGIEWRLRPVVYAKLLDAFNLTGPVEVDARRRYFARDVVRSARHIGVDFVGPPAHPFRSLEALRTMILFADEPNALEIAQALARAAWRRGHDLSKLETIEHVVAACGFDVRNLHEQMTQTSVKKALIDSTDEAIERGIFGVPTFVYRDEHFWGHDRLDQLARAVCGETTCESRTVKDFLARPRAVERKKRNG